MNNSQNINEIYQEISELNLLLDSLNSVEEVSDGYIHFLVNKYVTLANNILNMPEEQAKEFEIELAYILEKFRQKIGILIEQKQEQYTEEDKRETIIDEISLRLNEAGLLEDYQKINTGDLSQEEYGAVDTSMYLDFLNVMRLQSLGNKEAFVAYLYSLLNIYLYDNKNIDIIDSHLEFILDDIDEDILDTMIDEFGYLGEKTGNLYLEDYIEEMALHHTIPVSEAEEITIDTQKAYARLHLFLAGLAEGYGNLFQPGEDTEYQVAKLINELRDIIDTESLIPFYLPTNIPGEGNMVEHYVLEGKTIH